MNCHPAGDRPRQGDERRLHQPPVVRGADGHRARDRCAVRPATRAPISNPAACPGIRNGISRRSKWRGKARRSARSARRSKIPHAMAVARSRTDRSTSAPTRWSAGPGLPASAAHRLPARKRKRAPGRGLGEHRRGVSLDDGTSSPKTAIGRGLKRNSPQLIATASTARRTTMISHRSGARSLAIWGTLHFDRAKPAAEGDCREG